MADLDLEALEREFEAEWQEPEENTETEETEELGESQTEDSETSNTEEELETEEDEETDLPEEEEEEDIELDRDEPFQEKPKQSKEENAAFAELRRQKEALEQQNKTLEKVAAQYGMTVEQFQEAYQQQQEEARAQEKGIPVDVLRRMEHLERQVSEQQHSATREKFWSEVDTVKAKYDLTNQDIDKIFSYIGEQGLVDLETKLPSVGFEFAYKAANFDNVLERKAKEAKQEALAAKKARQAKSAKGHTGSTAGKQPPKEDFTVDEVEKILREQGMLM
ncbi:MAG: hypothetical protein ACI33P_06580 [Lysinibacillus sp.]